MTRRRSLLLAALVIVPTGYLLGYYLVRVNHELVRYESNCIARAGLHQDFWQWEYACADLRRYVRSSDMLGSDPWESFYSRLIAGEELVRGSDHRRQDVCDLPPMPPPLPAPTPLPTFRPWWCPGALGIGPSVRAAMPLDQSK
jgi:hypothetical protein